MFESRAAAGERLAERVDHWTEGVDVVLAVPRGGVPVARPVADRLAVPLAIVAARRITHPDNPEVVLGAVADGGQAWYDEGTIARTDLAESAVDREREHAREAAERTARRYREDGPPDLRGRRALLVDDGVETGATARVCVDWARSRGADRVVVATPVASPAALATVETVADDVVVLDAPDDFHSVDQFYRTFGRVTDEDVLSHLHGATSDPPVEE